MNSENPESKNSTQEGISENKWERFKLTPVEKMALRESGYDPLYPPEEKIPSIIVDHFPALGRLTAARFLEWVQQNPEGAMALPTGKTPEFFIKFVQYYLQKWGDKKVREELESMGLDTSRKPDLSGLRFVQIDEFFPIDTRQHNSFYYYVNKFYIKGFGLDPSRALFINPNEIGLSSGSTIGEIFPQLTVDITLRVRKAKSLVEKKQQAVLIAVDQFCTEYERKIRQMGGLGFFLGGIGPDGHIAFNVRGTDYYSTTRLCRANYETKAAAAGDLGGIEVSRHKHVITIGLSTITYNPDAVAIVIAAGEAKANIVAKTIHSPIINKRPGTALESLPRARFYLTHGAAKSLTNRIYVDLQKKEKIEECDVRRVVMDLSQKLEKPFEDLEKSDFEKDRFGKLILDKDDGSVSDLTKMTREAVLEFIRRGNEVVENKTFLHTAPHHDDIILAYLPWFTNQVRQVSTDHYFAYMTSGFNAVTNDYMERITEDLLNRLNSGEFAQLAEEGYFDPSNEKGRRLDTAVFLNGAARHHPEKMQEGVARRYLRNAIEVYEDDSLANIRQRLTELLNYFKTQYPGKKDINIVQQLKGRCREFESDLTWAYYGFTGEHVRHLRLGFYKGDIFTERPTRDRDVPPILNLFKEIKPDYVSVAFDPEGSGPDTHYKVLQAVAHALKVYEKETGRSDIKVIGYRNVWFKFHPSEANLYVPTTLTHLNDMEASFDTCFTTQRTASFPSYEYDGPFSRLARKIQCKQYSQVRNFLGEDYFTYNDNHILRAAKGMVYLREMSLEEFYNVSEALRHIAEDID